MFGKQHIHSHLDFPQEVHYGIFYSTSFVYPTGFGCKQLLVRVGVLVSTLRVLLVCSWLLGAIFSFMTFFGWCSCPPHCADTFFLLYIIMQILYSTVLYSIYVLISNVLYSIYVIMKTLAACGLEELMQITLIFARIISFMLFTVPFSAEYLICRHTHGRTELFFMLALMFLAKPQSVRLCPIHTWFTGP